ncbi:MAG TPA: hypothetical protein VFK05_39525 [Polyangiaceae bacterium]|nr:hypothetical protein [Polyangiaceae bacterium]
MSHHTFDVLDPPHSQLSALAALVDKCVATPSRDGLASNTVLSLESPWPDASNTLATRCRYHMVRSEAQSRAVSAPGER